MRKVILVLAAGLLAAHAAPASEPEARQTGGGSAIGGSVAVGGGSEGFVLNPGISFRLDALPVFWGVFAIPFGNWHNSAAGFGASADWHFLGGNLITDVLEDEDGYTFNLVVDWFLGAGGFAGFYFLRGGRGMAAALGARFPAGLSWRITRQWELALSLVPSIGMYAGPPGSGRRGDRGAGPQFHGALAAEIAGRHWLRQRPAEGRRGNGAEAAGGAAGLNGGALNGGARNGAALNGEAASGAGGNGAAAENGAAGEGGQDDGI